MKAQQPSPESYAHAAWFLRCDVAAIMAVAEVEARRDEKGPRAFNDDGSPFILYEPHKFSEFTGGKYDRTHPHLSQPEWNPKAYGKYSDQHRKLDAAQKLDRSAALMSCSWGLFQVLGANYRRAGFDSVQGMVNAAFRDVDEHLRMFVWFVVTDRELHAALIDIPTDTREGAIRFARRYNGKGFRANRYDEKIVAAFERLRA